MIFSLQHFLSGGTKLSRDYPNKIGKPLLHIFETRKERTLSPDSHSLEIQTLTNFLCSNKIEILNVPALGNRRNPAFTSGRWRCCTSFSIGRLLVQDAQKQPASRGREGVSEVQNTCTHVPRPP